MQHTLSTLRERGTSAVEVAPVLYVAMHGYGLRTAPSRHLLEGVTEVSIGRGDALAVTREGSTLEIRVPDPWMSSTQTRLKPVLHRWVIEDLGSRNGTLVGGDRVGTATLVDGDLIEIGHTFFVFRQRVEVDGDAADQSADEFEGRPPGLATLIPPLAKQFRTLDRIAPTNEPVMILGETGTGKEFVSRALHKLSGRSGELVAVNCGALPETLVEGALYGHTKGAFSGAVGDRRGFVRAAHEGTLLLDEIGDLRLTSQAALLRVLQENQVIPVGGEQPIDVDVRVCSATHRPLERMIESGEFREDLLARMRGFTLELPPLRDRVEDVGLLVRAVLAASHADRADASLSSSAGRALFMHDWPQNIRELARALGAALALAGDEPIAVEHLPAGVSSSLDRSSSDAARPELSDEHLDQRASLVALLRRHNGNVAAVAREVGKGRQQIHRWLKRFDINIDDYRS